MSRTGRYWLFFVIVAVGLALSWGQVGRKTQRVLQETPVVYLQTEADCRPFSAPCAALGGDRALIVGPAGNGLRARQTGFDTAALVTVEVIAFSADGGEVQRRVLPLNGDWLLLPVPSEARRLRYRITSNSETTAAEFPLAE